MSATQLMFPQVEVAIATDPGRDPDKQVNEDSARRGLTPFGHLFVVCDGMGGHEGGREASTLAVETLFRYLAVAPIRADTPAPVRIREVLRDGTAVANREVHALGSAHPVARPGSTIVAALVHSLGTEIAHVGDSRCYLLHAGELRQVTRDHSMVQQMVDAGKLSPEQAVGHPDANQITRALGITPGIEVELQPASIVHAAGDVFVLCSDGLSDLVTPAAIRQLLLTLPLAEAATELVGLANGRGGPDNITVILVRTLENALAAPVPPASSGSLGAPPSAAGSRPRLTESMPAYVSPGNIQLGLADTLGPGASSPAGAPPVSAGSAFLPPGPPSSHAPRRRTGTGLLIGVLLLGAVGVVAAIILSLAPGNGAKEMASPALPIVLPSASLEPAAGIDDADASTPDGGGRPRRLRNKSRKQ